ncbi:MAG: amino acid ABC transporter substrate-binding protein [Burkholderiales bacterium]|nr:amino acid ABC transporter substrate-binding protein [Burkholderiales bacterium]
MRTRNFRSAWRSLLDTFYRAGAASLLALGVALPALAQEGDALRTVFQYTGTLKRIQDTGAIRIGYRQNSIPFAFLDPKGKPVGYALDLCDAIVDEVSTELGKEVRTDYRPVTPENRFDLLIAGEIDLECGSSTNTIERRKRVAFSPTTFVTGTKLLVRRDSRLRFLRDLKGRTIVVTLGTVQDTAMRSLNERQKLNLNFVTGADHRESFQILESGKADAWANDEILLYGMLAETRTGAKYRVVGDFLTYAAYALAFRKDDPEFAEIVDRAFGKLAGSREIVYIYNRWFLKRLPSGVRLDLPMSPHLEELFRVQGLPGD